MGPVDSYLLNLEQNDFKKVSLAKTPVKQNPKSEYRNPKQTGSQINLKSGKSKALNPNEASFEFYYFWLFEFVSDFGFRASSFFHRVSDFEFDASSLRRCSGHALREWSFFPVP